MFEKLRWMMSHGIRDKHAVSTKVALYSDDGMSVLVMRYPHTHGLPGGHIDKGETPDQALRRELNEELAIEIGAITPRSFFRKNNESGSIVLAYSAIIPKNTPFTPPQPKFETGIWLTKEEFTHLETISDYYKSFTLEHWPQV